jgi:hypothetical protein
VLAIVVRDLPYLKLLQPVINELTAKGCKFVLICVDSYKSEKEYNRPNKARVIKSMGSDVGITTVTNDVELTQKLAKFKVTKLLSVEIGLWNARLVASMLKSGIKLYSVEYLTDSMWNGARPKLGFTRVYYTTRNIRDIGLGIGRVSLDAKRDLCIGSPIFDQLDGIKHGQGTLIMMPNIRATDLKPAFRNQANLISLIESFGKDLIIKTRRKQWMPPEITRICSEVHEDGDVMYPSAVSKLFARTSKTVLFCSSGVYEAVYAGQYVVNVRMPLSSWRWNPDNMMKYFGSEVYNYKGVVETVEQANLLAGKWTCGAPDPWRRQEWVNSLIGVYPEKSYLTIARDVMNG